MQDIRSAYDILSRVGWRQKEINAAIDRITQANEELARQQQGFGPLIEQAEKLMQANPGVEAVECGGSGQVLIKLPTGGVAVLALTPWPTLLVPNPIEPEPVPTPCLCRNGELTQHAILTPFISQDARERIQAGRATEADRDMMAAAHAYSDVFDDPDLPEEGKPWTSRPARP